MAKWGEIKCPRCAELEAKLERADGFPPQAVERFWFRHSDILIEKTSTGHRRINRRNR
jgi:hypothetical protein